MLATQEKQLAKAAAFFIVLDDDDAGETPHFRQLCPHILLSTAAFVLVISIFASSNSHRALTKDQ